MALVQCSECKQSSFVQQALLGPDQAPACPHCARPLQSPPSDATLSALTAKGWEVVHRDANGVQVKKRKHWNRGRLGVLVLLPMFVGLLSPLLFGYLQGHIIEIWLLTFAGVSLCFQVLFYMMRRDKLEYVNLVG